MKQFVVLAVLAVIGGSLAAPRPDVSHLAGYSYQAGGYNGNLVANQVLSAPLTTVTTSYQPTAAGTNYYSSAPSIGQLNLGSSGSSGVVNYQVGGSGSSSYQVGSSSVGGGIVNDNIGLAGLQPGPTINYNEQESYISHLANFQPAQINKHFYIHSAPEDHDEQQIVRYVNVGRPQKNYRVVFINAPTSTASKAKIIANVAPVEEKTAIYVLSKKSNALDVTAEVVTQRPVANKPEVFFVKYKTPQEAAHAQQTIQANYDALGGSSETSNEGVIPVSSVIGSLGDNGASGVLTDASGSVNIVGTGGVPTVDAGASYDAEGSQRQVISTVTTGTNAQATYLPVKPVRK
uniref:IP11207p n=1 Tax=Drosophila melanogaster TaxID=7227 RepID=Q8IR11_DROME|eukprot:NP_728016.1 TweedleX [Drosophila melanogaster]